MTNFFVLRPVRSLVTLSLSAVLTTALFGVNVSGAATAGPTNAQREAAAHREVASLIAHAPLPAGSRSLAAATAEKTAPFSGAASSHVGAYEVSTTRFFLAPSASAALRWLAAQRLEGHRASAQGASGSEHTQSYLLSSSSYLLEPTVVYIALARSTGTLEFSVTASVWWKAERTALIPAGATRVTAQLNRGPNVAASRRHQSASSTSAAFISSLIARLNALPVPSPLPTSCPMDVASSLTLSLFRTGQTTPSAVVLVDPSGCGIVTITQYNAEHVITSTGDVSGGRQLAEFVASHLGLTNLTPA